HEPAEGNLELTSQDGTKRILGYQPLSAEPQDLYVSAGMGVDYSYGGIYAATFRSFLVVGLAVAIAILASSLFGSRFITQPLARLVAAAERWRAGDLKANRMCAEGTSSARLVKCSTMLSTKHADARNALRC
ncbi:MAG TPA: hypothetical protein VFO36_01795, partial [Nitrospiraceae bacterium]|nr:hypothetical protein [Nitrospiraceae bacterium]